MFVNVFGCLPSGRTSGHALESLVTCITPIQVTRGKSRVTRGIIQVTGDSNKSQEISELSHVCSRSTENYLYPGYIQLDIDIFQYSVYKHGMTIFLGFAN